MNIPLPDNGIPIQPGDPHYIYKEVYHPIHWHGDTPYRPRVETLVIKDGELIFLYLKKDVKDGAGMHGSYELPGGSIDADSTPIEQAENETNEEALISIKDIYDTGIQYYEKYPGGFILGGGDTPLEYEGHISSVFVANYSGLYDKRAVEDKDLSPKIAENGKFYRISDVCGILKNEHVTALLNCPYIKPHIKGVIRLRQKMNNPGSQNSINIKDFNKKESVGELLFVSEIKGPLAYNQSKILYAYGDIRNAMIGYQIHFKKDLSRKPLLYVYCIDSKDVKLHTPTNEESPSAKLTGELQILEKEQIQIQCIGLIQVITDGSLGYYYYGKHSAHKQEYVKCDYKWISKNVTKHPLVESSGVVPGDKLYHGSTYEITEFEPRSLNLGNIREEPGWCTFAFADYIIALRFGLMRAIQKTKDYWGKEITCTWDIIEQKPYISSSDYNKICDLIQGFRFYVYTIDATNLDVGIGNDDRLPEYTFSESGIQPEKTDELVIDNVILTDHLIIVPDQDISEKIKQQEVMAKYHHVRGWYAVMMTRDYNNGSASAELQKAVSDGKLRPGDDIREYMNSHGISFEDDAVNYSSVQESISIEDSMIFISEINMDNKTVSPRIPNNFMTQNGYEDSTTKRICFAPSVDKALMGLSKNLAGKKFFVHRPATGINKAKLIKPSVNQVPDVTITGKIWYTSPVKLECIGKIVVNGNKGLHGHKYNYGNNTAELYDWNWDWLNTDPITESLLISNDTFDIRFDKFESGEYNTVLVTGLSGSGKTTLATKISDKYHAELIELDCFECCYMFENDDQLRECGEVFYQYLSTHKPLWDKLKSKSIRGKDLGKEIDKFVSYCVSWCKRDTKNKYVIEGVQIYGFLNKQKISGTAIVFVGTSTFKSLFRRLNRERKDNKDLFQKDLRELPQCIRWYIDENKMFEKFKKSVMESTTYKSSLTKNFKNKSRMKLSSFKKLPLNKTNVDKYKNQTNHFNYINLPESKGYIFVNDDELVAFVIVDQSRDDSGDLKDYNWITDIEVTPKYRGHGLSKQLLDIATDELKGDFLTVTYDNEVAINLYKSYGFKIGKNSYDAIKSGKSKSKMYTMFYKNRHPKDMEFVHESTEYADNISFATGKLYVKEIIDSLPMHEKRFIGNHVDEGFSKRFISHTKNLKDREVLLVDNIPVAFLDVYTMPHMKPNEGTIVLAVRPGGDYRRQGYGTILVDRMQKRITETGITKLIWEYDNDNVKSGMMALTLGFKKEQDGIFSKVLETEIVKQDCVFEVAQYSSTNKYPVFITLIHTGTKMATLIKKVTGDEFSHATISFNAKLHPTYSFGTKKLGGKERRLVVQSPKDEFFDIYKTTYATYVMYINRDQRKKMLSRLQYFIDNEPTLKYDAPALIACALHIPTEFRKKWLCSRFVAEILNQGDKLSKVPSLWKPQELTKLENISLVNAGNDFGEYDYKLTNANLQLIKSGRQDEINVVVSESKNIFESGEFSEYAQFSDLVGAQGDIQQIQEPTLFSKKDIYHKFEDFDSGKSNLLFIFGTNMFETEKLARDIKSKHHVNYIIDMIHVQFPFDWDIFDDADVHYMFRNYFKKYPNEYKHTSGEPGSLEGDALYKWLYQTFIHKFIKFVMDWCKENKNKKVIITGSGTSRSKYDRNLNIDEVLEYPTIIMGTPAIKANYSSEWGIHYSKIIKSVPKWLGDAKEYDLWLDKLRKATSNHTKANNLKKITESTTYCDDTVYRITYDGDGVYNALKKNISPQTWRILLNSKSMSWLPKPPSYAENNLSYFTKDGYDMFMKNVMPIVKQHLDPDKIKVETFRDLCDVCYSDKYQVVTESVIFSTNNINYNMELWETKKNNILLITGLSGSGQESATPIMEAPKAIDDNKDGDEMTDYTADVEDNGGQEEDPNLEDGDDSDDVTDYTEDADTEDETEPNEEPNDNGGEDDEPEESSDYTSDAANEDDIETSDNSGSEEDTGTEPENNEENGNPFDNNVLKNYSLLKNFEKLYELTKEVSDSLDSKVEPTKLQNTVLAQVLKNLNSIREFILSYVKFQFSEDKYSQNLYYYNIVVQSLKLNLKILKLNKELVNNNDKK